MIDKKRAGSALCAACLFFPFSEWRAKKSPKGSGHAAALWAAPHGHVLFAAHAHTRRGAAALPRGTWGPGRAAAFHNCRQGTQGPPPGRRGRRAFCVHAGGHTQPGRAARRRRPRPASGTEKRRSATLTWKERKAGHASKDVLGRRRHPCGGRNHEGLPGRHAAGRQRGAGAFVHVKQIPAQKRPAGKAAGPGQIYHERPGGRLLDLWHAGGVPHGKRPAV